MSHASQVDDFLREVVSELVATTPEWWDAANLKLLFSAEGEVDSCEHEISSTRYPNDVVVATDELMSATRNLNLYFKQLGRPLKSAVIEIQQGNDKQWHFIVDFTYQ